MCDLTYRRWLPSSGAHAERWEVLGLMASNAVLHVRTDSLERRIARLESGESGVDIDVDKSTLLMALARQLERFKEWPLRSSEWEDPFHPQRAEALGDPALVRNAVWDLWRDFNDWPTWRQVVDRLVTTLDITSDRASTAALMAAHDETSGVHAVFPGHLLSRRRRCDDMADYRWIIEEPWMLHEEVKYQWRLLLGDVGVQYRTPLSLLMDRHPLPLVA